MKGGLTIGELARRCGVSRDTVRFYERLGLLPLPRRSPSGYRLYGREDEDRLHFIRRAKNLGLTLDDVAELIRLDDVRGRGQCAKVAERLRSRIEALDDKMAELAAFRGQMREKLALCEAADSDTCPVAFDRTDARRTSRS